jgi:hypothetical protein
MVQNKVGRLARLLFPSGHGAVVVAERKQWATLKVIYLEDCFEADLGVV